MSDYIPKIMKEGAELTSPTLIASVILTNNTINQQESTRQSHEADREFAETQRDSAESARVSDELTRESNENDRIADETTRQDYYNAYRVLVNYNSSTSYIVGNKVTYQGGTYQCITNTTGNSPTYNTDNTWWKCIAAKGTDGAGGDMFKSTYDPNSKNTDAFNSANQVYDNTTSGLSATDAQGAIDELKSQAGDLGDLDTTSKSDLVGAVNEVNGNIGTLSNLNTTNKTNTVSAINELVSDFYDNNQKHPLYSIYSNMFKDTAIIRELNGIKTAIARNDNTIKIAFVGDSITEGYNNLYNETYTSLIIERFKKYYGTVTVTNFALGGRNLSNFNNSSYVATNPETDITLNYWRSWSTVGQSWKDAVKDYGADLIIMSFGHNETTGAATGQIFFDNVYTAYTYLKTSSNTIIFLSSLLQSKEYGFPTWIDECGNVARSFPRRFGCNLIDVNKVWNLMVNGINKDCLIDEHITESSYSGNGINLYGSITFSSLPSASEYCLLDFRKNVWNGLTSCYRLRFYIGNVELYKLLDDTPTLLHTWSISSNTINIDIHGSMFGVNNSYVEYNDLYLPGWIQFVNSSSMSNIDLYSLRFSESGSEIKESVLLGEYQGINYSGTGGNGLSHPSPAGHYFGYFLPFTEVFKSIELLQITSY